MIVDLVLPLAVSAGLFVYLVIALLRPEASAAKAPAMCHNSASGRRRVGLVGFVTSRSPAVRAGRRLRS